MEESLRKVKTLGQADEDIDDLAKWVTKSRTKAEEEKELAREEALAAAERRQAEQVCAYSLAACIRIASYVHQNGQLVGLHSIRSSGCITSSGTACASLTKHISTLQHTVAEQRSTNDFRCW
jgi:hypothetical protein